MTHRSHKGFTVVELLVVLAIMAGLMAISFSSFSSLKHAKLRAEAMRMSGALRMVYGRAAVNGIRYEVQIDLDANSISVHCSEANVLLEVATERPSREDDPEADPFGLGIQQPTMEDCSEPLLETMTARDGISFERMVTTHHTEPVDSGTHTIAYFPNGFVERTMIWLKSDQDSYMTLSIDPMTGRVMVSGADLEVPDDFFQVEED